MLLRQLGQLKGKQYLHMLNAKKTFGKKLTLVKNRLEHRIFCFEFAVVVSSFYQRLGK